LTLIPYTVDSKYDLQYTVENVRTGERYSASVADSYHTTVEFFLMFAAPIATRGQKETMNALADHLYQQLRDGGAFSTEGTGLGVR
jgi:hypothetical protein